MEARIQELKARLARLLARLSYKEGDFVLASGKRSDYYFDCRQTSLHPEGAWLIGSIFAAMLKDEPVAGVGGMTMGADPLVTATSLRCFEQGRALPGFLVRKEPKGHGTRRFIEGLANFAADAPVALLEDVVTTGGSILAALERARAEGLRPVAVYCVLDREEGGAARIREAGYGFQAIFTRKDIAAAQEQN